MAVQVFFVVDGVDADDDDLVDAIHGAFDEIGVAVTAGLTTVQVVLDGPLSLEALRSAAGTLEGLAPGVLVLRLDRDLVAIPEIANRAGLSAEAVRLLVGGARGPGGFPSPTAVLAGGSRVWEWAPVLAWMQAYGRCVGEPAGVPHSLAALFDAELVLRSGVVEEGGPPHLT